MLLRCKHVPAICCNEVQIAAKGDEVGEGTEDCAVRVCSSFFPSHSFPIPGSDRQRRRHRCQRVASASRPCSSDVVGRPFPFCSPFLPYPHSPFRRPSRPAHLGGSLLLFFARETVTTVGVRGSEGSVAFFPTLDIHPVFDLSFRSVPFTSVLRLREDSPCELSRTLSLPPQPFALDSAR